MDGVRCVIADIPQRLLADIVQNMADESGIFEVVDRVNSLSELPAVVARQPVDVLIMGMDNTMLPKLGIEIMRAVPNLPIVALVDDGRRMAVYLDNVGKNDLLRIVRALRPGGTDASEGGQSQ